MGHNKKMTASRKRTELKKRMEEARVAAIKKSKIRKKLEAPIKI